MYEKQADDPVILFASPPFYEELCAVKVHVINSVSEEMHTQPHVIRCRELIFTESDIIASPSLDFDNCFHVIMQHKLYKTGKLQARFNKKGLKASNPYRVIPALYQACLRYTLTAKIAPQWNKVGEWLLQGRDFLSHCGYTNGIKMNLIVNSKEVYMSIFGTLVKCPHLQVHDLDIDTVSLTGMFEGDEKFQILQLDQWCYILPSVKKGRIVSVSKQIPEYDCPFRTYRDLKKHWKNTYGYRLPDTDEDLLFYQVTFLPLGGRLFTYPSVCLCSRNLQTMSRVESKPIITSFLLDIQSKIHTICGQPFQFQTKIRYPQQTFQSSSMVQEKSVEKPNLVSRNPNPLTIPLRNLSRIQHNYKTQPVQTSEDNIKSKLVGNSKQNDDIFISQPNPSIKSNPSCSIESKCDIIKEDQYCNANSVHQKEIRSQISNLSSSDVMASQNTGKSSRIIPVFRPKSKTATRQVYKPELSKKVPSFSDKQKPSVPALERVPKNLPSNSTQPKPLPIFSSQTSKPTFAAKLTPSKSSMKPVSTPKLSQKTSINTPQSRKSLSDFDSISPNFISTKSKKSEYLKTHNVKLTEKISHIQSTIAPGTPKNIVPFGCNPKVLATPKPNVPLQKSKELDFSVSDNLDTSFDLFNNSTTKSPVIPSTPKTTNFPAANLLTPKPIAGIKHSNDNWLLKTPDGKAKKRKETGTPSLQEETEAKKSRSKPKLQDVDVEQLARSNQLGKANAITLTTWLKHRNIPVKAKDKKGDLVDKVLTFLNLARPAELQKSTPNHTVQSVLQSNTLHCTDFDNSCSSFSQMSPKSTNLGQSIFSSLQTPEQ